MLSSVCVSSLDLSSPAALSPSSKDELIGNIVAGKFRLEQRIGIGAAGSVYRAEQTSLGRTVAVKVLRPELADDPRFIRRFHDEALAASRLNHPNVVSVIDFGQADSGQLYLVMEFLRGVTLSEVLRSESLDSKRISEIIRQVLSALEEAHESGVVHADLKADNIMIEHRRGGWDLVKVVDFGIARLAGSSKGDSQSRPGDNDLICGTPEYMAPEVILGGDPTPLSDIYAVGIILYELLVGYTPFSGVPVLDVLQRQLNETPIPPSQRGTTSAIPIFLEQATLRAIKKDPADRFCNALGFLEAISDGSTDLSSEVSFICSDCDTVISSRCKFCPECGAPLSDPANELEHFELALDDTGYEELWADDAPTADIAAGDFSEHQHLSEAPKSHESSGIRSAESDIFPLPLIGQENELNELKRFVTGSDLGFLQLQGPSGSGRSRLVREVFDDTASLRVWADAGATEFSACFRPIREMVSSMLGVSRVSTREEIRIALHGLGLNDRDVFGIVELFDHNGRSELDDSDRRREIFSSTIRVFRGFVADTASVLVFEDFELYDWPSRQLLQAFVESNRRRPAARILITCDETTHLTPLADKLVALQPLNEEDLRSVVTHCATRGYPDLLTLEELRKSTKGSPLIVQQLLRYAKEGGDLADVPESLADLVAARVGFLPGVAQRVLQAIAVFGLRVWADNLRDILTKSMGVIEMNAAVQLLGKRDMLRHEGDTFVFCSRIVWHVVYEAMPRHVRSSLHGHVGELLSRRQSDPAILGMHAERSGQLGRAAELLIQAGDDAARQFDDVGAADIFRRALEASRAQLLKAEDNKKQRPQFIAVSTKLAESLRRNGEARLARGILDEAKGHCAPTPDLLAQLLRTEAELLAAEDCLEDAITLLREGIDRARPMSATDILGDLYLSLADFLVQSGKTADAIGELEEALSILSLDQNEEQDDRSKDLWRLLLRLGELYRSISEPETGLAMAHQAVLQATSCRSGLGLAQGSALLAELYEEVGDVDKSRDYRARAVDAMRKLGDRRATSELLLSGCRSNQPLQGKRARFIQEARLLAEEVGWAEGVERAEQARAS